MKKAIVSFSLVFLSIFIAGCDNGDPFKSPNVPSKLKVQIERQIIVDRNDRLTVYAMDFYKEGRILTFVCPCHIPGSRDDWLNVRVEGDSFKLFLLPDAEYRVEVQYWAPNADGNTEANFLVAKDEIHR